MKATPCTAFGDRRHAHEKKREAILNMALQLFLERGYHGTTLNEVAERLNITKPALYNYFTSKEDMLVESYRRGQETIESNLNAILSGDGNSLEKLRKFIRAYASTTMTIFGMSFIRLDHRELSPTAFAKIRSGKRTFDAAFRALIENGMTDGSITPCDAKLATFTIVGALNWIGHWYKPDGEIPPHIIADEFATRLTEGLGVRTQCRGSWPSWPSI